MAAVARPYGLRLRSQLLPNATAVWRSAIEDLSA
jgi:hypothetical protein